MNRHEAPAFAFSLDVDAHTETFGDLVDVGDDADLFSLGLHGVEHIEDGLQGGRIEAPETFVDEESLERCLAGREAGKRERER